MSQYTDIIERLNSATGADHEIDARIKCTLLSSATAYVKQSEFNGAWCIYDGVDRSGRERLFIRPHSIPNDIWRMDNYTSSVDDCIALIERVLPIASVEMASIDTGFGIAHKVAISTRVFTATVFGESYHSLPIALLIALFKALEAKEAQ